MQIEHLSKFRICIEWSDCCSFNSPVQTCNMCLGVYMTSQFPFLSQLSQLLCPCLFPGAMPLQSINCPLGSTLSIYVESSPSLVPLSPADLTHLHLWYGILVYDFTSQWVQSDFQNQINQSVHIATLVTVYINKHCHDRLLNLFGLRFLFFIIENKCYLPHRLCGIIQ